MAIEDALKNIEKLPKKEIRIIIKKLENDMKHIKDEERFIYKRVLKELEKMV